MVSEYAITSSVTFICSQCWVIHYTIAYFFFMYIEPVAPGTYLDVVVSSTLPTAEGSFRVTTECYPISGDWKNVRLTKPEQIYKVGLISCLYQNFVVYQSWIETPAKLHGQFVSSDEVILPWFIYLDLYQSPYQNLSNTLTKDASLTSGSAPDDTGIIFSSMFGTPEDSQDPGGEPTEGLTRFIIKYKPSVAGLMLPVDSIIIDNISDNVNIDLGIEFLRGSIHTD